VLPTLALLWLLRRQGRSLLDATARRQIPRLLLCGGLMIGLVYGLDYLLAGFFTTRNLWLELPGLALLLAGALLGYGLLVHLTGAWRWQELRNLLRKERTTSQA
jgi:peptidoglycan biosynthesis protein MviN/MurJ (putative lipid II flippase)